MGSGATTDVDDSGVGAAAQQGQERLREPPGAKKIGLEYALGLCQIRAAGRFGPVDVGGSVVDEHVDATWRAAERTNREPYGSLVGDVERKLERAEIASGFDVRRAFGSAFGCLRVARADENMQSSQGEVSGDLQAQTVRGPRHQCHRVLAKPLVGSSLDHACPLKVYAGQCIGPFRIIRGVTRLDRAERERRVLDTAARLFYARGVHAVGMDELVTETGLGKATVYRLFPTKDLLVGAYLDRLAAQILADIDTHSAPPAHAADALGSILDAVEADVGRPDFRGCPFNNASVEYGDPEHPARVAARQYRINLHDRLLGLARRLVLSDAAAAERLASQLAVLIDGAYTNAAHLGPSGPAKSGLALARQLVNGAAAPDRSP